MPFIYFFLDDSIEDMSFFALNPSVRLVHSFSLFSDWMVTKSACATSLVVNICSPLNGRQLALKTLRIWTCFLLKLSYPPKKRLKYAVMISLHCVGFTGIK